MLCFLRSKNKDDKVSYALIAGFVAGSTYYFKPSLTVASIALTTLLQVSFPSKITISEYISYILDLDNLHIKIQLPQGKI